MTKDEILSMAQHCWPSDKRMWSVDADLPRLERFAALVAEKEREACLNCIKPNSTPMEVAAAIRARGNK